MTFWEFIKDAGTLVALLVSVISILMTMLNIRAKRHEPGELRLKNIEKNIGDLMTWKQDVDRWKEADNSKTERNQASERVILHSLKGILQHLATQNHTEEMKKIVAEIDKFLIER